MPRGWSDLPRDGPICPARRRRAEAPENTANERPKRRRRAAGRLHLTPRGTMRGHRKHLRSRGVPHAALRARKMRPEGRHPEVPQSMQKSRKMHLGPSATS